ncbi:YitT family protein [Cytobacillus spongiae]|uniref:YitT family protein n=1 Tax=Cytobacillus spongiae TaxID=2901381 RepID=UPI001F1E88C6|nr:YitT family protein [Cytobacillus spongiae]UII54396.1 YitT family protein [Cytobacillus spongiae]
MFIVKKASAILIGSVLLSIGINFFLVPFEVLDGGIIGLGLIVKYLLGIKAGLVIIFMSIPIFLLAWFYNRDYFFNSLHGMLFSSFTIDVLFPLHDPFVRAIQMPAIASSIIGGLFIGLGIGIMLRQHTSTGGTDLLAQFVASRLHVNVGLIIFLIDGLVICLGGLLISSDTFFLSVITICCVAIATIMCTWNMTEIEKV